MSHDTRIALFLMGELVAALRANGPDLFKRWLLGGVQDLGEPAVTELMLDWLDPFLTVDETEYKLIKTQKNWLKLGRARADCLQ